MQESYKKSAEFLQKDDLHFLLSKVKEIKRINDLVLPLLDDKIRQGCQVANMANGQLILLVQNASIATSIRYLKPTLLAKFSQNSVLKSFTDIHCIVRIPNTRIRNQETANKNKISLLSKKTAITIMNMAETIDDPKLKVIMEKIASHTKYK